MRSRFFQLKFFILCFCAFALTSGAQPSGSSESPFRLDRQRISKETDLLTIFGEFNSSPEEVPLLSVLLETMGDDDPSNDQARYLWALTYSSPDFAQHAAATIPFFYFHAGNKVQPEILSPPPPLVDLQESQWRSLGRILWSLLQIAVFDDQVFAVRTATRTYSRNADDYRQEQTQRAIAILSMVQDDPQLLELQARLMLSSRTIGALVKAGALARIAQKQRSKTEETRGRNWELLCQRAEAERLLFEPLTMPDGSATHAMLWVAREDLKAGARRKFNHEWHYEIEWLRAIHETKYSNALLGLHEQLMNHPPPNRFPANLSPNDRLLERFRLRQRSLTESDLLVLASSHWNFNVRDFNPGGNHGAFFRVSTHSTLMFAGGPHTNIPKASLITEPYDSLSFAPTVLALMGHLQNGHLSPLLRERGFHAFPGRIIQEVLSQR